MTAVIFIKDKIVPFLKWIFSQLIKEANEFLTFSRFLTEDELHDIILEVKRVSTHQRP